MARIARRTLLTTAAAWPLATLPLRLTRAGEAQRVLVLVELNGGNDGLNTVVPYADPGYRRARPSLAVARDQIIPLDNRLGFHPALAPLLPAWRARELAIALGVGTARPNRSHFRRSEEHTSELQPLMRHQYAAFCL